MHHNNNLIKILNNDKSEIFQELLEKISDPVAKTHILRTIDKLQFGDKNIYQKVEGELNEITVNYHPGYYVYFSIMSDQIILLTCGEKHKRSSLINEAKKFLNNNFLKDKLDSFRDYDEFRLEILLNKTMTKHHLEAAIEEFIQNNDSATFVKSIMQVVIIKGGIDKLSKKTRLNRRFLHQALLAGINPKIDIYGAVISGLGFKMRITTD